MLFLNPAYPAAFLFGLRISALFNDCEFQYHSLFKQGLKHKYLLKHKYRLSISKYWLNIGKYCLNVSLIM